MIASNPLEGERIAGNCGLCLARGHATSLRCQVPHGCYRRKPGSCRCAVQMSSRAYWQMPEKTASEFTDDGFFSSPATWRTMDGQGRVRIVGREKDLVISGGLNIYPKEIEDAMDVFEGVNETAVIGVPHADLGEGLVAVICPTAGRCCRPRCCDHPTQDPTGRIQSTQTDFYRGRPAA